MRHCSESSGCVIVTSHRDASLLRVIGMRHCYESSGCVIVTNHRDASLLRVIVIAQVNINPMAECDLERTLTGYADHSLYGMSHSDES